jgi:DNA end-binding protein Ku
MSQRERLVALEPRDKGIVATMLRSYEEVREMKQFFDDIPNVKPDRDMIAIAEKIIAQKEEDFDPKKFDDRYEEALKALIEEKRKGHKVVRPKEAEPSNVINLMDALKKSLSSSDGGSKKSASRAKPAAPSRAAKKPAKRKTSG